MKFERNCQFVVDKDAIIHRDWPKLRNVHPLLRKRLHIVVQNCPLHGPKELVFISHFCLQSNIKYAGKAYNFFFILETKGFGLTAQTPRGCCCWRARIAICLRRHFSRKPAKDCNGVLGGPCRFLRT